MDHRSSAWIDRPVLGSPDGAERVHGDIARFAQVQTESGIHCYGSFALESNGLQASSDRFLIEVVGDDTLRIERQTSNCSGSPAFSSPFEYRRS